MGAQHTDCDCRADEGGFYFCPLHRSAPTMLAALEEAQAALARIPDAAYYTTSGMHERIAAAIREARGEQVRA